MSDTLKYIIVVLISYLCGSLNFSIIVSKYANGSDIRGFGSGNAGITNYIRSFGTKSALGVLIGDVLKCVVPVLLAGWMVGFMGKLVAGIAVILGHMFPVFFRFRGGKGVLTTAALILVIDWRIFLICISLFAVIVQFTRYVSLGSVCAVAALPFCTWLFYDANLHFIVATVLIAALVIFMHRSNIKRLIEGTESKFKMKM
ncbi:MAG: glycerol-3-phosphate 1-O-acyltransferase PlsY [Clostridiales bacterium]|jgi:glycerol-3-phosphate acyltransferase PlsY|nr:glycerol-3-phosphate 1-O-acyltransferase PlsY [Clostridiales bacterium]